MTRPYSMDLRDRAVARVLAGESVRSVASILSISAATVVRWSGRHRATGSAAPGKIGGHKVGILSGPNRDWLLEQVTRDFTLRGLDLARAGRRAGGARGEGGLCAGLAVRSRRRSELQKKAFCPPNNCGRGSRGAARSGRSIRVGLIPTASSSLMKPGPRRTWPPYAAGHRADGGFMPRCLMAIGAR